MCSFLKQQSVLRVGKWCILQKTVSPLDPRQRHLFLHNYKQERTLAIFEADFLFSLQPMMAFSLYPESLLSSPGPSPCLWLDNSRTFVKFKKKEKYTHSETLSVRGLTEVSHIKKKRKWLGFAKPDWAPNNEDYLKKMYHIGNQTDRSTCSVEHWDNRMYWMTCEWIMIMEWIPDEQIWIRTSLLNIIMNILGFFSFCLSFLINRRFLCFSLLCFSLIWEDINCSVLFQRFIKI